MYTLYHGKGACSLAVHAALELVDATYHVQLLDLSKGEQRSEEYLAINPYGKVPALRKGDFTLSEGMAIHLFLSDQFPESPLLPKKSQARAEAYRWLAFVYSNMHPQFSRLFSPQNYGNDSEAIRANARVSIEELFKFIAAQLGSKDFLAGPALSAADLYLAIQLQWAEQFSMGIFDLYPTLANYAERIYFHPKVGHLYRNEFGIQ